MMTILAIVYKHNDVKKAQRDLQSIYIANSRQEEIERNLFSGIVIMVGNLKKKINYNINKKIKKLKNKTFNISNIILKYHVNLLTKQVFIIKNM